MQAFVHEPWVAYVAQSVIIGSVSLGVLMLALELVWARRRLWHRSWLVRSSSLLLIFTLLMWRLPRMWFGSPPVIAPVIMQAVVVVLAMLTLALGVWTAWVYATWPPDGVEWLVDLTIRYRWFSTRDPRHGWQRMARSVDGNQVPYDADSTALAEHLDALVVDAGVLLQTLMRPAGVLSQAHTADVPGMHTAQPRLTRHVVRRAHRCMQAAETMLADVATMETTVDEAISAHLKQAHAAPTPLASTLRPIAQQVADLRSRVGALLLEAAAFPADPASPQHGERAAASMHGPQG